MKSLCASVLGFWIGVQIKATRRAFVCPREQRRFSAALDRERTAALLTTFLALRQPRQPSLRQP
jgi:hypothetical protein